MTPTDSDSKTDKLNWHSIENSAWTLSTYMLGISVLTHPNTPSSIKLSRTLRTNIASVVRSTTTVAGKLESAKFSGFYSRESCVSLGVSKY